MIPLCLSTVFDPGQIKVRDHLRGGGGALLPEALKAAHLHVMDEGAVFLLRHAALIHYMRVRGLAGFWQEGEAATGDMIPAWDLTGVCQN